MTASSKYNLIPYNTLMRVTTLTLIVVVLSFRYQRTESSENLQCRFSGPGRPLVLQADHLPRRGKERGEELCPRSLGLGRESVCVSE